ncbi:MAG: TetR/AcrR family transcriptional regulator [Oligoflexales bacterium]
MPKIVDHEQMRKELLSHSFHYFAYQGYKGVTMRSLAKALDISTGTLYHYFANKSDLFTQMLYLLAQDDLDEVVSRLGDGAESAHRLSVLFDFISEKEEYFRKLIFIFCDLYRSDTDGTNNCDSDYIVSEASSYFLKVTSIYADAIDKHLGLSQKMGQMVISFVIGQLLLKLIDRNQEGSVQFLQWFTNLVSVDHKAMLQ